ncbi:unnamed protein product, partial [marine sediment metagenome]
RANEAQRSRDDAQAGALADQQFTAEQNRLREEGRRSEGEAGRASQELQTQLRQTGATERANIPSGSTRETPEEAARRAGLIATKRAEVAELFKDASTKVTGPAKARIDQLKKEAETLHSAGTRLEDEEVQAQSGVLRRRLEILLAKFAEDPDLTNRLIQGGAQIDPVTGKWFDPSQSNE